ncbi:hypothetical protein HrrHc1_045 [Halorubrum phage Hardycor1]|nr:hypothetical protein HrrHc1_045 [Halorubrum phage Hardycor1]
MNANTETTTTVEATGDYTLTTAAGDVRDLRHALDETDLHEAERGDRVAVTYNTAASGYTSTKRVEGRVISVSTGIYSADLRIATRDGVRVVTEDAESVESVVRAVNKYGNEHTIGSLAIGSETGIELLTVEYEQVEAVDEDEDETAQGDAAPQDENDDEAYENENPVEDAVEGDEVAVEWESERGTTGEVEGEVVVDHYSNRSTPDHATDVRVVDEDGEAFVVRVRADGLAVALDRNTRRHDHYYGRVTDATVSRAFEDEQDTGDDRSPDERADAFVEALNEQDAGDVRDRREFPGRAAYVGGRTDLGLTTRAIELAEEHGGEFEIDATGVSVEWSVVFE